MTNFGTAIAGVMPGVDAPDDRGVESDTDGAHERADRSHQEDEMSETAGTVLRASRLRMELVG